MNHLLALANSSFIYILSIQINNTEMFHHITNIKLLKMLFYQILCLLLSHV